MLTTVSELIGYSMKAVDGHMGSVCDFYFDDQSWSIRYVELEAGKWLDKRIFFTPEALLQPHHRSKTFPVRLSCSHVAERLSSGSSRILSREKGLYFYDFLVEQGHLKAEYSDKSYPSDANGATATIKQQVQQQQTGQVNSKPAAQLRSATLLTGCKIQSDDVVVGKLVDFILEVTTWRVRYIVIKTSNLEKQKYLLINAKHLSGIGSMPNTVDLNL